MASYLRETTQAQNESMYDYESPEPEAYDYVYGTPQDYQDATEGDYFYTPPSPELGPQDDYGTRHPTSSYYTPGTENYEAFGGGSYSPGYSGQQDFLDKQAAIRNAASGAGGASSSTRTSPYTSGLKAAAPVAAGEPEYTLNISRNVLPTGTTMPTFKPPEWDEKEIGKAAAKISAPALRSARMNYQQALNLARAYENPVLAKNLISKSLAGYGLATSQAMASAYQAGTAQYTARWGREYQTEMGRWQTEMQKVMNMAVKVSGKYTAENEWEYEKLLKGTSDIYRSA